MSAFDANLRAVEQLHHRLVGDLQAAVTVLALVPGYREHYSDPRASLDPDPRWDEMERLARLYADPALIEGVACENVIERLSEGLIE